jgi:uncharacterized protein YlxP (DUF503 family)
MFVGLCRIDLYLPASRSLKAKRSLIQRVKGRLTQRFQASVAEVDHQDLWQRGCLGVAVVGSPPSRLKERLAQMRRMVEQESSLEVVGWIEEVQKFDPEYGDLSLPELPEELAEDIHDEES